MADNIRVLIVEDNPQLAESICSFLEMQEGIEVIGMASNANEAIDLMETIIPDTILLDLVMPQSDGFILLKHIRSSKFERTPQVIVLSAVNSDIVIKRACDEGAVYYITKPFLMSVILERIKELSGSSPIMLQKPVIDTANENKNPDDTIATYLMAIGIPSHLKGYRYLLEGVKILLNKPEMINHVTQQLYPGIGSAFNTSPGNVERAIRTVIDAARSSGRLEKLNELLGYNVYSADKNVTNAAFISLIANGISSKKMHN